jgi:hypothetical protein
MNSRLKKDKHGHQIWEHQCDFCGGWNTYIYRIEEDSEYKRKGDYCSRKCMWNSARKAKGENLIL